MKIISKNLKILHFTSSLQILFPTYGSIKPHATIGQIDGMITDLGVFQMICSSAVEGGSARKQTIIFEKQTRGSMVIIILQ